MSSRRLGPRYISNKSLARMKARYAHLQQGDGEVSKQQSDAPKRRKIDTTNIKSLAADLSGKANEAIDLAEEALRREERLKAAEARDDSRRAPVLNRRGRS